jgi:hypothetical protein
MPQFQLTAEMITGFAGVIVSLVFSYFPVLREKFAGLTSEAKSGVMLGIMAAVTASVTALNYYGILDAGISFEGRWLPHVIWVFVVAVIGNQATYNVSPVAPSVQDAKDIRDYGEGLSGKVLE